MQSSLNLKGKNLGKSSTISQKKKPPTKTKQQNHHKQLVNDNTEVDLIHLLFTAASNIFAGNLALKVISVAIPSLLPSWGSMD